MSASKSRKKIIPKHVKEFLEKTTEAKLLYSDSAIAAIENMSKRTYGFSDSYFWEKFKINLDKITTSEDNAIYKIASDQFYRAIGDLAVILSDNVDDEFEILDSLDHIRVIVSTASILNSFEKIIWEPDLRKDQRGKAAASKMRDALLKKVGPEIKKRKKILIEGGFNIELIAQSRKEADAIVSDFTKKCSSYGIKTVTGKQIQRYAQDILKERHESQGHP